MRLFRYLLAFTAGFFVGHYKLEPDSVKPYLNKMQIYYDNSWASTYHVKRKELDNFVKKSKE